MAKIVRKFKVKFTTGLIITNEWIFRFDFILKISNPNTEIN